MESKPEDDSRLVSSVSRALAIIELMAEKERQDASVSEVARHLGIGRSTAHQLLRTLTAHGFAEQPEGSPRYRLGTRLIRAGAVAAAGRGLGPEVTLALEDLVRESGETCSIGIMAVREIVLLHRVEAQSVLRVDLKVGTRLPLLTSAIGQVILASLPLERSDHLLDLVEAHEEARAQARRRIVDARRLGYAIVRDAPVAGINAIAAPITSPDGPAVAGLVVAGPGSRFEPENCIAGVLQKAREISHAIDMRALS